jgi:hypothetical protein
MKHTYEPPQPVTGMALPEGNIVIVCITMVQTRKHQTYKEWRLLGCYAVRLL